MIIGLIWFGTSASVCVCLHVWNENQTVFFGQVDCENDHTIRGNISMGSFSLSCKGPLSILILKKYVQLISI